MPQGLLSGLLLGLIFLLLSYLRVIGDAQSAAFDHAAFKAVFEGGPILGTKLAEHITWFALAVLVLHLAFGVACWWLARLTSPFFPPGPTLVRQLTAVWFIWAVICVMIANAGEFPRSSMGSVYARAVDVEIAGVPLHHLTSWLFGATVAAVMVAALIRSLRAGGWRGHLKPLGALLVVAGVSGFAVLRTPPVMDETPQARPNIILVGIDSLRHDEVLRPEKDPTTPNIDAFLSDATRFIDAMTPLARTFPSWVALLTGTHPHTSGAILNLLPDEKITRGKTLPEILRERGYHTAYAIDEVRFSNVDAAFGFDQVVAPRMGSADFILGIFSDAPLFNFVVNTDLGKWMFPYSHANRAMAAIYEPDAFVERIRDDVEFETPMLLATHLTLPHWPFSWRDSERGNYAEGQNRPDYYQNAVRRADEQFGQLMRHLEQRGLLRNAIVIAFSDHGETFEDSDDLLIPRDSALLADMQATPGWGHGTTVLAPQQYRIFFAIRGYGPARTLLGTPMVADVPVSIEDITPTVLALLDLDAAQRFDGMSLEGVLRGEAGATASLGNRVRFTETEFNPRGLIMMQGGDKKMSASSINDALQYYRVDPETDRLEMKTEFLDMLKRSRQFAAVGETQLLGVFPRLGDGSYEFLSVALSARRARRILAPADISDAETRRLWSALCARYGGIVDAGTQAMKCSPPMAQQASAH